MHWDRPEWGKGGVCGSCLDSPWVYEQWESGRSHKSSQRGAGFTLITIIRYFSLSLSCSLNLSLSLLFFYPALAQWAPLLSFDPWKKLVMFFWRVWCTKGKGGGGFRNRLPLSDLDFGSLGRPLGVYFFLSVLVSLFSLVRLFVFVLRDRSRSTDSVPEFCSKIIC